MVLCLIWAFYRYEVMNIKSWDLLRYFYDLNDFGRQTFNGGWLSVRIFPFKKGIQHQSADVVRRVLMFWITFSCCLEDVCLHYHCQKYLNSQFVFFSFHPKKSICLVKVVLANENIPAHPLPSDIINAVSSNNTRSFQSCTVV